MPQLGWTPDSRNVAFQHLNRAQNELELRLLPGPARPREPLGRPAPSSPSGATTWVNLSAHPAS